MESSALGKLIFYTALLVFLLYFVHSAVTGQFDLVGKLGEVLRFK